MISNTPGQPAGAAARFLRLLESLNGDGRYGLALLACVLACVAASCGGARGLALLRYERTAVAGGQYWRLISAHLTHLNLRHLLLNLGGLVLLWALFARDYRARQWLLIVLCSIAAIDAGLWLGEPQVLWYAGASGVLHGIWAAGAIASCLRRERDGALLGGVLVVKLAYEHWFGPNPLDTGLPVITVAHLYGAAGGATAALIIASVRRRL